MVRILGVMLALVPALAMAQQPGASPGTLKSMPGSTQGAMGQGGAQGQQVGQPSANENQSQIQTNNSQQPGNVTVLPPTSDSQRMPNPMPELSR